MPFCYGMAQIFLFLLQFFVHQFQDIMRNDSAGAKELSLAIRGYGLLAAVCADIDQFLNTEISENAIIQRQHMVISYECYKA